MAFFVSMGKAALAAINARVERIWTDRPDDFVNGWAVERTHRHAGRCCAVRQTDGRNAEGRTAVESRSVIETGVGRNIGNAVPAADDERASNLESGTQARTEIVVVGLPEMATAAGLAGENDATRSTHKWFFRIQINRSDA